MGEDKRRKESESGFGVLPKTSTVRGLIINLPIKIETDSIFFESTELDIQELRTSLLYWDRLSMPTTNLINIGSTPDEQFLIECGILEKPKFIFQGGSLRDIINNLASIALIHYEKKNLGAWSLGGGKNSILTKFGYSVPEAGTSLKLLQAMPTPSSEVPLAEILQFKSKRRDELIAFRSHLDVLVAEIESSSDYEDNLAKKLLELDKACMDLAVVCREWQFPCHITNTTASINFTIPKAVNSALKTWLTTAALGFPLTATALSAAGVAISSGLEIKAGINFQKITRPRSPFKYAYEVQKNLI